MIEEALKERYLTGQSLLDVAPTVLFIELTLIIYQELIRNYIRNLTISTTIAY
jgi:hypothetical protein